MLFGQITEADIVVYGGTSGGVSAAVQAARMGKRVVLLEPGKRLGGMTSGGLSAVDIGDPPEFYCNIERRHDGSGFVGYGIILVQ